MGATKEIQPCEATGKELGFLTPKQRRFCEELSKDKEFNLSRAAEKAGYAVPAQASSKLMKDPNVRKYLGHVLAERSKETLIDAPMVLRELACLGFSNIQDFYEENGGLVPLHRLPREVAACIASVKTRTDKEGNTKIVEYILHDKLSALGMLAKHVGILKELAPNLNLNVFDWNGFINTINNAPKVDPIEERISNVLHSKQLPYQEAEVLNPEPETEQ